MHKAAQASCPEGWAGTPKDQYPGSTEAPPTCHKANPPVFQGQKRPQMNRGDLRGHKVTAACPRKPGIQQPCTWLGICRISVPVRETFKAAGFERNLRGRGQHGHRCPQGHALAHRASQASSVLHRLSKALGKGSMGLFKEEGTFRVSGRGRLDKPPRMLSADPKHT